MFGLSEREVLKLISDERNRYENSLQELERSFKRKLDAFEMRSGGGEASQ